MAESPPPEAAAPPGGRLRLQAESLAAVLHALEGRPAVALFDRAAPGRRLRCLASIGLPDEHAAAVEAMRVGPDVPLWGRATWSGQPETLYDPDGKALASHLDLVEDVDIGTALVVPVHPDGDTLGLVCLYWPGTTQPRQALLELVTQHVQLWALALLHAHGGDALAELAMHDDLTGLPGRALFLDHLQLAWTTARRTGAKPAVLFIDLDRFKLINDSLGHRAGDVALKKVAERLTRTVRPSDTVARLAGDEFVVLCPDVAGPSAAAAVADRVTGALHMSVEIDGRLVPMSASVGVALVDVDAPPTQALESADIAMYRAKTESRGTYLFFDESMQLEAMWKLMVQTDLPKSLRAGHLELHYQPIVRLDSRRVIALEALLRWTHPEHGLLYPDQFLPIVEQSGGIQDVGAWVLDTACRQVANMRWPSSSGAISVCVNVSPRQLVAGGLISAVDGALAASGLSADLLTLELTERSLVANHEVTAITLGELRDRGTSIALDDFGTGFSSIGLLQALPVDLVKIDRSFVNFLPGSDRTRSMVRGITRLAHAVGTRVWVSGVEQPEHLQIVRGIGCDAVQGYLLARPQPLSEVVRHIGVGNIWQAPEPRPVVNPQPHLSEFVPVGND